MLDCPGCKAGVVHDKDTFQAHMLGLCATAGCSPTLTQKLAEFAASSAATSGNVLQKLLTFINGLATEAPTLLTEVTSIIAVFQGLFATTVQPTPAPAPAPTPAPAPAPAS